MAGFRSGDKILSVNGQGVSYYEEWDKIVKNKAGETLLFEVQSKENKIKSIRAFSAWAENPNPLEWKRKVGFIEGLSLASLGLRIGIVPGSPAYKAGLRTFDEIVQVEGQKLKYWRELEEFMKNFKEKPLSITVKRESETLTVTFAQDIDGLSRLGIEPSYLYIERVGPKTPVDLAGLMKGDRLISINEELIQSWEQVLNIIQSSRGPALEDEIPKGV